MAGIGNSTADTQEREECSGGFQSTPLTKAARFGQVELVATALECTATNLDAIGKETD